MGSFTRLVVLVATVSMVVGCNGCTTPDPVYPTPIGDGGAAGASVGNDSRYCPAACAVSVGLGCVDATVCIRYDEPTSKCEQTESCEQWCDESVHSKAPAVLRFQAKCIATTARQNDTCATIAKRCSP